MLSPALVWLCLILVSLIMIRGSQAFVTVCQLQLEGRFTLLFCSRRKSYLHNCKDKHVLSFLKLYFEGNLSPILVKLCLILVSLTKRSGYQAFGCVAWSCKNHRRLHVCVISFGFTCSSKTIEIWICY